MQKSTRELLAAWKPQQNLDLYEIGLDPNMALLSHRAVLKGRVDEAAKLCLLAVNGPAIPAGIKKKVLYQLGLMYLAPDNLHPNRGRAIEYLHCRLSDYPEGELSSKAGRHLD